MSKAGTQRGRAAAGLPHATERRVGNGEEVRRHRSQRLVAVPRELLLRVERQLAPRVERDKDGAGVAIDGPFGVAAAERVQQARLAQVHELREVGRVVLLRPVLRQHLGGRQRGPRAAGVKQDLHPRGAACDHGGRLPLIRSEVEGGPTRLRTGRHDDAATRRANFEAQCSNGTEGVYYKDGTASTKGVQWTEGG